MGIKDTFKALREGSFRVRIIPKQEPRDGMAITSERNEMTNQIDEALDSGKRIDLTGLRDLMSLKTDRNEMYKAYEEMVADGRIGAAVEMYANDTVQLGQEGSTIWVESDNPDVAAYGNKLLEDLNVDQNVWSWAYCLWLYGDVYLELFENTSTFGNKPTLLTEPINHNSNYQKQLPIEGAYLERYIEKVPNPADIYDLQFKGKTSGYIKLISEIKNERTASARIKTNMLTEIDPYSFT